VVSGARSIPVVDAGGRFQSLVPPDRLLRVLEREHDEDLARMGGFLAGASAARAASHEVVLRRLWHRLPWLALGLVGAMTSPLIVGAFEEEIRKQVLLAFFVPAVVYRADVVGTQTETVVIRGMALGVPIRSVFARELATGLVIGGASMTTGSAGQPARTTDQPGSLDQRRALTARTEALLRVGPRRSRPYGCRASSSAARRAAAKETSSGAPRSRDSSRSWTSRPVPGGTSPEECSVSSRCHPPHAVVYLAGPAGRGAGAPTMTAPVSTLPTREKRPLSQHTFHQQHGSL
jgi:hypothetical protein